MPGIHLGNVSNKNPANRIGLAIFFSIFFLLGSMFLVFMLREAWKGVEQRRWTATPCTILASEVGEKSKCEGNSFVFQTRYEYEWNGRKYTSDVYRKNYNGNKDYSEAVLLKQRYAVNASAQAFVNPQNLSEAILQPQDLWVWAFVFIPVIFMLVGAGGVYFILTDKSDVILSSRKPLGTMVKGGAHTAAIVFFIFALIGSVFSVTWSLPKFHEAFDSQTWEPMPCRIISSRLDSHYDSDSGTTYSINILYSYNFNGAEYKSNRYDLIGGSSSGKAAKRKVIKKYAEGKKAICFVNPKNPFEAALVAGWTGMHFILLMPVIFALVGISGFVIFISKKISGENKNPSLGGQSALSPSAQTLLKAKFSPMTKFSAFLIGTIIEIFVTYFMIRYAMQEKEWGLLIFSLIFSLIAVSLIFATIWNFLALFNPRLEVTANSRVPLGGVFDVSWKFLGDVNRLERLQIHLKGSEEATHQQGKHTHTEKNVFAQFIMLDTTVKWDMASGQCPIEIPPETMHSFNANSNKIIWNLTFEAQITHWPDVKEDYPIEILPKGAA